MSQWTRHSKICYSKIRLEKLGENRKGKEDTIKYSCQWRNNSGGKTGRSFAAMQQFSLITERWKQQWKRWCYYLQNLQDPLDRTDGEMWRLGSVCDIFDEYICPLCYGRRRYIFADYDFLCSICIRSLILMSYFYSNVHSGE